jgi:anti-sigma B factor antagonist
MTSTLIDPRAFALIDDELDGRPVLVVVGELDLFTGPELRRRALERVEAAGGGDLVLDMSACPLVDSAGCAALLAVTRGVRARGGRLIIAGPTEGPARVFEMMGLADLIPVVDELDDIAALPRG